jgi:hypothetical protein
LVLAQQVKRNSKGEDDHEQDWHEISDAEDFLSEYDHVGGDIVIQL